MRIAILKESLDIGGTERSAANISRILAEENSVYTLLFDSKDIKYEYGGELVDVKAPPKNSFIGKLFNTALRSIRVNRIIKGKRIDVLYTFTGIGNYQTLSKCKNAVKIISARDYGGMRDKYERYHKALLNSDAIICNSELTKQFYLSKYPEHKEKAFAVYNVIDANGIIEQSQDITEPEYFEFVSSHSKTIVSVGRFCKEKGFEYLIEAVARAREKGFDIGLILVGDGEYKQRYLEIIKRTGIEEDVYFAGFQKNPYKYMAKCSCFVLSSLSEGFPNVLAEAMALGLPVIAANCRSGPAEILRDDSDYNAAKDKFIECDYGIISPQIIDGDNSVAIEQMSCAIMHLLEDEELMKKYSECAKERVKDFSQDSIKKKFEVIFKALLDKRSSK